MAGDEGEDTGGDSGDSQQARTKGCNSNTETFGAGEVKTETNGCGDLHQDGNRTRDRSKGIADRCDDSHQDRTKLGVSEGIGDNSQASARKGHATQLRFTPRRAHQGPQRGGEGVAEGGADNFKTETTGSGDFENETRGDSDICQAGNRSEGIESHQDGTRIGDSSHRAKTKDTGDGRQSKTKASTRGRARKF